MDQDLYGVELFLDRYGLIEQAIDYTSLDLDWVTDKDIFEFCVNWEIRYCINYKVIYMPFYQYVKEYQRKIQFRVRD